MQNYEQKFKQRRLFSTVEKQRKYEEKTPSFLKRLQEIINFENFRQELQDELNYKSNEIVGGRPPIDCVLMFKIIMLQKFYNCSDDRMEFMMHDSLSVQKFIGLDQHDDVPDSKTIWKFRDQLSKNNVFLKLFYKLSEIIEKAGFKAQEGQIVDATMIETRKPCKKKDDNNVSKKSKSQIDTDATFTKKHGKTYHGYKGHIRIDAEHKIIRTYDVTTASTHDSQVNLIDETLQQPVYGDSAYKSQEMDQRLASKNIENKIMMRAYRNKPLTEKQKLINKQNAKVRSRVEHVFGDIKRRGKREDIRCVGIVRARLEIGLKFFIYNLHQYLRLSISIA